MWTDERVKSGFIRHDSHTVHTTARQKGFANIWGRSHPRLWMYLLLYWAGIPTAISMALDCFSVEQLLFLFKELHQQDYFSVMFVSLTEAVSSGAARYCPPFPSYHLFASHQATWWATLTSSKCVLPGAARDAFQPCLRFLSSILRASNSKT